jgi:hypothetical protein
MTTHVGCAIDKDGGDNEVLGVIALILFIGILVASIRGWIPQDKFTLQSLLVLGTIVLLILALIFGETFRPGQLLAVTILHPITATIAGFLLAGAVEASGGFAATSHVLSKLGKTLLGQAGVVVLLVNIPSIFAMPCGRVWAAALIPVAVMFGADLAGKRDNPGLVAVIVFGLIINAAASCGPSPLGGIGMMGEGTAGFDIHIFSNPQQLAIMVITVLAMGAVSLFSRMAVITIDSRVLQSHNVIPLHLPWSAYATFLIYMIGLAVIFVTRPPVPIQTLLLGMTITVMILGKVSIKEMMEGVIIHPVTAMVAGFMMAGALLVTGGFDVMITLLSWLAQHTFLGFIGVSILLIYLPAMFPMPCGRIIAAVLLPGVIMFGQVVSRNIGNTQCLPAILVAFILCCATSCAPSPLGGIGSIGEGNLGLRHGISARALQFSILLGVPVAALVVTYLGLSQDFWQLNQTILAFMLGGISGMLVNVLVGERPWMPGGILSGLLVGALVLAV